MVKMKLLEVVTSFGSEDVIIIIKLFAKLTAKLLTTAYKLKVINSN